MRNDNVIYHTRLEDIKLVKLVYVRKLIGYTTYTFKTSSGSILELSTPN